MRGFIFREDETGRVARLRDHEVSELERLRRENRRLREEVLTLRASPDQNAHVRNPYNTTASSTTYYHFVVA